MKVLITLLLSLGLATTLITGLTGCASTQGVENVKIIQEVKEGMSKSEILYLLGSPDSISALESTSPQVKASRWVYEFKKKENRGRNFFVDFHAGKVVASGELDGRALAATNENRVSGTCTRRLQKEVMLESLCIK
jgi:outer membrane protein assembly factor BamE (lipoprotein component of BamABCDE complex)